jgi:hypothetical protein
VISPPVAVISHLGECSSGEGGRRAGSLLGGLRALLGAGSGGGLQVEPQVQAAVS